MLGILISLKQTTLNGVLIMFTIYTTKLKDAALILEALNIKATSLKVLNDAYGNKWIGMRIVDCGLSPKQVSCFLNEPNFDEVLAPWDYAFVEDENGDVIDYKDALGYPVPLYSSLDGEVLCSQGIWWDRDCNEVGVLPNYVRNRWLYV